MSITRTALCVLTAGLFLAAASLSVTAVILTLLGTSSLVATVAIGHVGRETPAVPDFSKVRLITVEPEDAIPAHYPTARQHVPYVELLDEEGA